MNARDGTFSDSPAARATVLCLHLAVILAPTVLLWNVDARFYYDWQNHEWFIGYFGEYWRQHHAFPAVIHAAQVVGLPQPIFYGYALFPTVGLVSAFVGAAWAIRIAVVLTFAAQYLAVFDAVRAAHRSRSLAIVVAASLTWATYPLTNLYNRAALTEFFGAAFLTTAIALAARACWAAPASARLRVWWAGLFGALAIGTHPPTAVLAVPFVVALIIAGLIARGGKALDRGVAWTAALVGALGVMALAPWIWANVVHRHDLYITSKLRNFVFFPDRTDSLLGRLAPFPYDAMSGRGPNAVSTPYAEAQIAFPLLLIAAMCLHGVGQWFRRAPGSTSAVAVVVAGVALGWFGFCLVISLSKDFAGLFASLAPYVQFPSRFTSHANLALLVFILAAAPACSASSRVNTVLLVCAAAVATGGVIVKLRHAAYVREIVPEARYAWHGERSALVTAGRLDSGTDYASVRRVPQLLPEVARRAPHVALPVGSAGAAFGVVGTADLELAREGWVITNATVFKWSQLIVDGMPWTTFKNAAQDHRAAVWLPAGRHHFEWRWTPDVGWVVLRSVAGGAVCCWILGLVVLAWPAATRDGPRRAFDTSPDIAAESSRR